MIVSDGEEGGAMIVSDGDSEEGESEDAVSDEAQLKPAKNPGFASVFFFFCLWPVFKKIEDLGEHQHKGCLLVVFMY